MTEELKKSIMEYLKKLKEHCIKLGWKEDIIVRVMNECNYEINPFVEELNSNNIIEIRQEMAEIHNKIEQIKIGNDISGSGYDNLCRQLKRVETELMEKMLQISKGLREETNEAFENNDKRYKKYYNTQIQLQKLRLL